MTKELNEKSDLEKKIATLEKLLSEANQKILQRDIKDLQNPVFNTTQRQTLCAIAGDKDLPTHIRIAASQFIGDAYIEYANTLTTRKE